MEKRAKEYLYNNNISRGQYETDEEYDVRLLTDFAKQENKLLIEARDENAKAISSQWTEIAELKEENTQLKAEAKMGNISYKEAIALKEELKTKDELIGEVKIKFEVAFGCLIGSHTSSQSPEHQFRNIRELLTQLETTRKQ